MAVVFCSVPRQSFQPFSTEIIATVSFQCPRLSPVLPSDVPTTITILRTLSTNSTGSAICDFVFQNNLGDYMWNIRYTVSPCTESGKTTYLIQNMNNSLPAYVVSTTLTPNGNVDIINGVSPTIEVVATAWESLTIYRFSITSSRTITVSSVGVINLSNALDQISSSIQLITAPVQILDVDFVSSPCPEATNAELKPQNQDILLEPNDTKSQTQNTMLETTVGTPKASSEQTKENDSNEQTKDNNTNEQTPEKNLSAALVLVNVPQINILAYSSIDYQNLGQVAFTVKDLISYQCLHLPPKNKVQCETQAVLANSVVVTTFYESPNLTSVVKGKGCTLKAKAAYLIKLYALDISVEDFTNNLIIFGLAKYILSRLMFGDFNLKYLLREFNNQFFKALLKSRFSQFIDDFVEFGLEGYARYFRKTIEDLNQCECGKCSHSDKKSNLA